MNNVNSATYDNASVLTHGTHNYRAFGRNNNPHSDPSPNKQCLCALSQLFAYNNITDNTDAFNSSL